MVIILIKKYRHHLRLFFFNLEKKNNLKFYPNIKPDNKKKSSFYENNTNYDLED